MAVWFRSHITLKFMGKGNNSLRYGIFIPVALMVASLVSGYISYSTARESIVDDLNQAIIALTNENKDLWTRQDTVAALRRMHETTHKPIIYQASEGDLKNKSFKYDAYFSLALVDNNNAAPKIQRGKIVSDTILLMPEKAADGLAIRVQGFADCSMASVFAASDQTLPGILLTLSFLSMISMTIRRQGAMTLPHRRPSLDGIKLTPMQRRFTQTLLDAPDMKVDKATLCATFWGDKSNAEESLYTLVRRTKTALAEAGIEIVCNRGDSYQIHITS